MRTARVSPADNQTITGLLQEFQACGSPFFLQIGVNLTECAANDRLSGNDALSKKKRKAGADCRKTFGKLERGESLSNFNRTQQRDGWNGTIFAAENHIPRAKTGEERREFASPFTGLLRHFLTSRDEKPALRL